VEALPLGTKAFSSETERRKSLSQSIGYQASTMKFSIFRRLRCLDASAGGNRGVADGHEAMIDSSASSDSDTSTRSRNGSSNRKKKQRQPRLAPYQQHQRQRHQHLHRRDHPYGLLLDDNGSGVNGNFLDDIDDEDNRRHYNEYRVAEVGRPPKRLLRKRERMTFKIHDFAQCHEKRGEYRISPTLQAHGYNWKLQIYPRGDNRSNEDSECISCFLHYFSSPNDKQEPVAKVEYYCGTHKTETQICTFAVQKGNSSTSWGLENYLKRDRVLRNHLDEDGALVVHVDVRIAVDPKIVWYPPLMRREPTLMQLYHSSKDTADVTFRLVGSSNVTSCYKAHKMILALRAKILYELVCEESSVAEEDPDSSYAVVDLPDIDKDIFEAMLEHIYTVKQPIIKGETKAKKLLVAADRFCLTDLKLYVESVLVDRFVTTENAASLLLLADSHSCALLKETTMDLYISDPNPVSSSLGWAMVEESEKILSELLGHIHTSCRNCFYKDNQDIRETSYTMIRDSQAVGAFGSESEEDSNRNDVADNDDEINRMDVFSLREELCEQGIDVDGSRETLVARLRNAREGAEERG